MIGTADLEKIIRVALATGAIKDEQPLNLLLIAKVGFGKTALVSKFALAEGVYYTNDSTVYSIHKKHGAELKRGTIKHIVIPDLLNALNKPKDQADSFITFMNSLIEEGIARVESRDSDFEVKFPVRVGLITCIAAQDYIKRQEKWATVGFLSRMLAIRYRYSAKTVEKVLESICLREYHKDKIESLPAPTPLEVTLPVEIAEQIKKLSAKLKDPEDEMGARKLKQLQTFVMGLAVMAGRDTVTRDDLVELARLSPYMRQPGRIAVTRGHATIVIENMDTYAEV